MNMINKFKATVGSAAVKAATIGKASTTADVSQTSATKSESLVEATPKQKEGLSELIGTAIGSLMDTASKVSQELGSAATQNGLGDKLMGVKDRVLIKAETKFEEQKAGLKSALKNTGLIKSILGNETCRLAIKAIGMTFTRITPNSILKKAAPEDAGIWKQKIASMQLVNENSMIKKAINSVVKGTFKESFRVSPENLSKIKDELNTIQDKLSDPKLGSDEKKQLESESKLLKTLSGKFESRINKKELLKQGLGGDGMALTESLLHILNSQNAQSPAAVVSTIYQGLQDESTGLKSSLQGLLADKDNPLRRILAEKIGEKALSGLTLLISDEGMAIADELVGLGKQDLMMSFLQDPMQMMMDNREMLMTAGSNIFDHVVDLVNKDSNIPLLSTLSNKKIGAIEIAILRNVLPMVKDAVIEHQHGIKPTPGYPSKTALLTAKIAQLVDQKLVAMGADPSLPEKSLGALVDSFAAQLSKATTMAESFNKGQPVVAARVSETYRGTALGHALSVKNTAVALFQNTVTQPILNKAKGAATMVGAGVVAGKIDKQLAKAGLTADATSSGVVTAPKEKPVKEETEKLSLTLDREKVQSFAVSTASMVFRALAENPLMIDSGLSAARSFVSDAVDMLSQEATPKERTIALTTLVHEHAETLGTVLRESGNSLAEKVGDLIADADTLLSSDLVQRSLRRSALPTEETISLIGQKIADKVSDKVATLAEKATRVGSEAMEKVSVSLDKVGVDKTAGDVNSDSVSAPKAPKEKKEMTYKVAKEAYDLLEGATSGKVDKPGMAVLRFMSDFVQDGG
jgi:hypothetical protein